jgi:hypothetical protein
VEAGSLGLSPGIVGSGTGLPAGDFIQVNAGVNEAMVARRWTG